MDVSRHTPLGTMPFSRLVGAAESTAAPPTATLPHACGGAGACDTCSGGGGSSSSATTIRGTADGPDITLASGVVVRRMTIGGARVSERELQEAIRGIQLLPAQDQQLIAQLGVAVELVPAAALENGILGATTIGQQPSGVWQPSLVRIAVRSPLSNKGNDREKIGEIVQHELGHVQAVARWQDRSEAAAERYALVN